MSDNFLISIITINYNDKVGLDRTVKSITNQTYQDFEYIVIDGGSTDGSKDIIEENKDKITYWTSEPDKGIYNAMNKGITKSNGKYLLFINSGDELFNSTVLEEVYTLIHTEDLIYFDLLQKFENHTNIHSFPHQLNFNTFVLGTIGHPTTFIKKSLFNKIGFYNESLKIIADWEFFTLAVVKYNCTYRKVDKVLSTFYMDGISSTNKDLIENERRYVFDTHFKNELRLAILEEFVLKIKNAKSIRLLRKIGLLKFIDEV